MSRPWKSSSVFPRLGEAPLFTPMSVTVHTSVLMAHSMPPSPPHQTISSMRARILCSPRLPEPKPCHPRGCVLGSVRSGCHNKVPHTRGLNNRKLMLVVLEAGSPRPGCSRAVPGENPLPGWQTATFSLSPHAAFPWCVCLESERELPGSPAVTSTACRIILETLAQHLSLR